MPPYVCLIKKILIGVRLLSIKWNETFIGVRRQPLFIQKDRLGIVFNGHPVGFKGPKKMNAL
jgi:hypothetical protein